MGTEKSREMQSRRIRELHVKQHPAEVGRDFHHSRVGKGAAQKGQVMEKQHEICEAEASEDCAK